MTQLNRETVEALLKDVRNYFFFKSGPEFYDRVAALAESYLATLDARRKGEREALRGMIEWHTTQIERIDADKAEFYLESDKEFAAQASAERHSHVRAIIEFRRRLAEGEAENENLRGRL